MFGSKSFGANGAPSFSNLEVGVVNVFGESAGADKRFGAKVAGIVAFLDVGANVTV